MFPCHVLSHQRHTNFQLNSTWKFQKILTTMIVGNKTPMLKPHLRDLNTQARKSSEKFFGHSEQGKIGSGEAQMARLSPHEHFDNSCVFQSSPFVSAEAMNESSRTDPDANTDMNDQLMNVDFHIQKGRSHCIHWFIRAECEEPGRHRHHEIYNVLFQQRHVDEIRTTDWQKQQNFRTCAKVALTLERDNLFPWHWMWIVAHCRWDDASSVARNWASSCSTSCCATWWFNAWDLPFYNNASVTRVQPLRRMLVRPRPSWFDWGLSEEPFAKLARTVSVCLSLNSNVVNFSNEPQKN